MSFKLSRDWYEKIDILTKWLHKFFLNLIWTVDFKGCFLESLISRKAEFSEYQIRSTVVHIFDVVPWLISKC